MMPFVYSARVTALRLNSPPQVLDYTKPYNQGGWIALHEFKRCTVRVGGLGCHSSVSHTDAACRRC